MDVVPAISILVIGRHEEIVQLVVRLINNRHDWQAYGTINDAEACQLFTEQPFRIVLLSSGIDAGSEAALRHYFTTQNPAIIIIQHYGGGSGLLQNEILHAIGLPTPSQPSPKPVDTH